MVDIVTAAFTVIVPGVGARAMAPPQPVQPPPQVTPAEVVYRPLLAPPPARRPPIDISLASTRFSVVLPSGEVRPLGATEKPLEPRHAVPATVYHPLPPPPSVPAPVPRVAYPRPTVPFLPMPAPYDTVILPPWNATTVGLTDTGSGTLIAATDADLLHGGPAANITNFTVQRLDAGTF